MVSRHSCRLVFPLMLVLGAVVLSTSLRAQPVSEGPGSFILPNSGEAIEVFTYKPPTYDRGPLLVVIHGSSRNAEDYRNYAIAMAEESGAIVAAPLFDLRRFSDERFKRGGGVLVGGQPEPRENWTFQVVVRLVADIRKREGVVNLPYYVIGHSGGGQFAAKMALFLPDEAVRFVAANPGSNVFPDRDIPFPYGLGGLPLELSGSDALRRYCAAPLTLYLGTDDVYQNEEDGFDSSPEAMRQGAFRLARNHNFFETMKRLAAAQGWPFNWRLVEVPHIGHSGARMFKAQQVQVALFGQQPTATSTKH